MGTVDPSRWLGFTAQPPYLRQPAFSFFLSVQSTHHATEDAAGSGLHDDLVEVGEVAQGAVHDALGTDGEGRFGCAQGVGDHLQNHIRV